MLTTHAPDRRTEPSQPPEAVAQCRLAEATESNPRALEQKALFHAIRNSAFATQRKALADRFANSPRVLQQKTHFDSVRNSPLLVAQRERIQSFIGSAGGAGRGAEKRRNPPVLSVAAPGVVQRFMRVGGEEFTLEDPDLVPARSNVRGLLTEVQSAFQRRGLVLTREGMHAIRQWCASKDLEPRAFENPEEVAAALADAGFFYSKEGTRKTTGPTTLGDRPGFQGEANKLEYGAQHGGSARRHVISSSTLGAAVEFSDGSPEEVNAFLVRHGASAVEGEGKLAMLTARRRAWELLHNHVGNLWIGPSPINTAIGFIRSTINQALNTIARSEDGVKVGTILQAITPPKGPMDHAAQAEWRNFVLVLNSHLVRVSDLKTGILNRAAATEFLLDASRNADLDVPHQHPGGDYLERLRSIHAQILGTMITGNNIFQENGTLDHFMALDAGTRAPDQSLSRSVFDGIEVGESRKRPAGGMDIESTGATAKKKLVLFAGVPDEIDGRQVRNVDSEGLNCLIRALLVAAGGDAYAFGDPGGLVGELRQHLVDQGFADQGTMLDLAGAAGAMLISLLVHRHVLGAERGLIVYRRSFVTGEIEPLTVLDGDNPIRIWLSSEHFRAVR